MSVVPAVRTRPARRTLLTCFASLLPARAAGAPAILVRSGWQTVNIGDIAHTPGLLAAIEKNIPEARCILWPAAVDQGVEPMLRRRFPRLEIVRGDLDREGNPATPGLREAFAQASLFLHGPAASITARDQVDSWRRNTGKPYGFFGVGFAPQGEAAGAPLTEQLRSLLTEASFVFTRETASLANLKALDLKRPETGFAPDGTFSMDILDEEAGHQYMTRHRLEPGRFLCVVPRLRYTPYHKIRKVSWTADEIRRREAVNLQFAERDHAKLRAVITAWVQQTGGKVLLCPEMTYELDILKPLLFDPLPAAVREQVVRRESFWLPDEASSIYKRAAAVISFECHSPILAAAQGTPCVYVHQPEDGIKGRMWKDIGLGDWYFEVDEASGRQLAECVLNIAKDGGKARRKVAEAVQYARRQQAERMRTVKRTLDQAKARP